MNRTPRDWLLARHAAAGPMLDALRGAALPEPRLGGREFLRELFRPARPAWTALAAVWLVLLVIRVAQPAPPKGAVPSPEFEAAWSTSIAQLDALLDETRAVR